MRNAKGLGYWGDCANIPIVRYVVEQYLKIERRAEDDTACVADGIPIG